MLFIEKYIFRKKKIITITINCIFFRLPFFLRIRFRNKGESVFAYIERHIFLCTYRMRMKCARLCTRTSRMSRTSLSDAPLLSSVVKAKEILAKYAIHKLLRVKVTKVIPFLYLPESKFPSSFQLQFSHICGFYRKDLILYIGIKLFCVPQTAAN